MNSRTIPLVLLLASSAPASASEDCGVAKVVAGNSCETLHLKFDISGCGESEKASEAVLKCDGETGIAIVTAGDRGYSVNIRMESGRWSVDGPVKRSGPETEKISRKTNETPSPLLGERFSFGGQFRFRHEGQHKLDYLTNRAFTTARVRTDLTFKLSKDATVFLQPQFARTLGEVAYVGSSGATNTRVELSGNGSDPSLLIHQAYGDYHPVDFMHLLIGRQVVSYGNEIIVGAADWGNVSRSFEGLRSRFTHGWGWSDVFAMKIAETNANGNSSGDKDFYGFYNGFDFGPGLSAVDFYVFDLRDATATPDTQLWTYGTRVQSNLGQVDYRAEYTRQAGVLQAYQADVEIGYTFASSSWKPRLSLQGLRASENFTNLFPTAHRWTGYADVVGRRNLTGYAVHGSFLPWKNFTTQIDYHRFYRVDRSVAAYKLNGITTLGSPTSSISTDIGQELDLTLKYQTSPTVTWMGGASRFFVGDYLQQSLGYETPDFYFIQMEMKF